MNENMMHIGNRAYQLQLIEAFTSRTALRNILRIYIEEKEPKKLNEYLIINTLSNIAKTNAARDVAWGRYWDLDVINNLSLIYMFEILEGEVVE